MRIIGDLLFENLYRGEPTDHTFKGGHPVVIGDRVKRKLTIPGKSGAELEGVIVKEKGTVMVKVTGGKGIEGGPPVGKVYSPHGWSRAAN